ncbi:MULTISPECIES: heme lyase NrfEFG subunit NrfF [Shewanella]|uniref:Formate-dependent nitrite reductase complex subunit n=1 Tax=Shewanella marisflavi TaxID=260364 RepID=A0AAC9XLY7_9GAMM|nr:MULTISPECIES: heme lyase NrfEFG subunit NrfF [Shewanella]ASJ95271.1 heme lyase NrfEFG subunit NrfF [Shewanella marisflavi]MCL1043676.1 heme lyase NrfEFG subunit NrfF [Shewanella marisflavi]QDF73853.1 heme lyase NrfEFG subunit NrfF [Shewanella marisflavi]
MKSLVGIISAVFLSFVLVGSVMATPVDTYEFKSVDNQKRALELAHSLRCPQCQNQNLIDSNSPVAQDLRLEVYQMVDEGKGDEEIIEFMTSRYGEFVLYKPRMEAKTYVLWLGPLGLLLVGLMIGFVFVRKQRISNAVEQEISPEEQAELDRLLKRDNK